MKDRLLIIVPSRSRPHNIHRLWQAICDTAAGWADLLVCLDDDDVTAQEYPQYREHNGALLETVYGRRCGFAPRLNKVAPYCGDYYALASWGDDHLPETDCWDTLMLKALHELDGGFVYGDDGIQHEALPTACAMTFDVVSTLGWLALPGLQHMFIDTVWLQLGQGTDRIEYLGDVKTTHIHPAVGKAPGDRLYIEANAHHQADEAIYNGWLADGKLFDVEKLRACWQIT